VGNHHARNDDRLERNVDLVLEQKINKVVFGLYDIMRDESIFILRKREAPARNAIPGTSPPLR
jgi:hypothetical protein